MDPLVFVDDNRLNQRLINLQNQCQAYLRDSGVNGLYMGFPFIYYKEIAVNRLPRIAPIFLWPINIHYEIGNTQRIALAFDNRREEVRINPALENMLGKAIFKQLQQKRDELLARSALTQQDVMDALVEIGTLLNIEPVMLAETPVTKTGEIGIDCCAVLFNANFVGQVIGEELRVLKQLSPMNTGLETALRLNVVKQDVVQQHLVQQHLEQQSVDMLTKPLEPALFLTAASDPSQENAVFKARQMPGLLVEGPPGTGKSQTIVNMVADAIGRGKSLLIICQKKAALEVVYKRLVAEQLGSRSIMINAINSDRQPIISQIREQVAQVLGRHHNTSELSQQRKKQADYIAQLEQRLDSVYEFVHQVDQRIGLSYRQLISELINLSKNTTVLSAPQLRPSFAELDLSQLLLLENECAPLVRHWLPARYEQSPLQYLQLFSHDQAMVTDFTQVFSHFIQQETQRVEVLVSHKSHFDINDPDRHQQWVKEHAQQLLSITEPLRLRLNKWLELFKSELGENMIRRLQQLLTIQQPLTQQTWSDLSVKLLSLSDDKLNKCIQQVLVATSPRSWLSALNIKRWFYHRNLKRVLNSMGYGANADTLQQLLHALKLEQQYRPIRQALHELCQQLDLPVMVAELGHNIAEEMQHLLAQLKEVQHWSVIFLRATRPQDVEVAVLQSSLAVESLLVEFEVAFVRYQTRQASHNSLMSLQSYFSDELFQQSQVAIEHNQPTPSHILAIYGRLAEVVPYQYFSQRARSLSPQAIALFMRLRSYQTELEQIAGSELDSYIRQLFNIEARLAWKVKLEQQNPLLLADNQEHQQQVALLVEADKTMRRLNRQFLSQHIEQQSLGSLSDWEAITRLTGNRALRLREFIAQGIDLGLMTARPVWLMTPDIASQVLPMKPGIFDVVIYDEASQMPVEYALPTLYRAKVVIVSGDEKQMPPTSFFNSQMQMDEEESPDLKLSYEEISEQEQKIQESHWNRQEIMDCPDLLQLARSVLPSTTLQIHYRSNYRELINFSNAAFYANQLNIPVQHSLETLSRVKPVELIQIAGVYTDQSNLQEAQRVLQEVSHYWLESCEQRPTLGVVTFNKKQAELIELLFNDKATTDEQFRQAYNEELNRRDKGENVSFFIKNVENVQGDERDVIIFSTTFGRNEQGIFRRNFGVLGQQGGEHRLNVAITRAKSRVVIISSMPIADISDMLTTQRPANSARDYLQSYLEYARMLTQSEWHNSHHLLTRLNRNTSYSSTETNHYRDGFLNDVAAFLDSLNIRYSCLSASDGLAANDAFLLDFAIKAPNSDHYMLGIECDPPYNPLLTNARAREIWRVEVLKRSVAAIYRISSSAWFSQPERIKTELSQLIEQLNHLPDQVPEQPLNKQGSSQ